MDIANVTATLEGGRFFGSKKMKVFLCVAVASGVLAALTGAVTGIAAAILQWPGERIAVGVFLFLFGSLLAATALWATIKNQRLKRKIALYLTDAVALRASVKRLDTVSPAFKPYEVQVEFVLDGRKVYKTGVAGNFLIGFITLFAKYDNKTVDILYSPRYDQVLLVKQQKDDTGRS